MPSRVIDSFSYKPAERRLVVIFTSGRCYSYHGVPFAVYEAMRAAFAKGEYFNQHIRDRYDFTREPSATMLELRRGRS